MSEIEKMYENAGFQKKRKCEWNKDKESCFHSGFVTCDKCKAKIERTYSPFTTEKQIELIKFITTLGVCEIEDWNDKGFHFAIKRERIYPTMFLSLSNINLQETLADVVNNLWQDLTEEEKQQVKGILESEEK